MINFSKNNHKIEKYKFEFLIHMENQQQKPQLFTELFRPKTLDQAIILPRIKEELSKGLVDSILFFGSAGCGKCLGNNEMIDIYIDEKTYKELFGDK